MRISHSGKSTLMQCGRKYELHYIEKLRSPKLFSSLFFGSALDNAFSRLLLDKKQVLSAEEVLQLDSSADEIFYNSMLKVENNGEVVEVSKSSFADYYSSDYTPELLTSASFALITEFAPDVVDPLAFMEDCKAVIKGKKKLSAEDVPLFNYITWLSLVEKGYLMLQAYREQIMPEIFEVYSIQEAISIKNESEDEISGLIDFTCSFVSDPGTMYVCDNKTSSKPYKPEETGTSAQLSTYCEFKQTNKAAYVVIEKKLYAKGPRIRTQILRAEISEATFADTFAGFEDALYSISTGEFDKNLKSCFDYGRMCPFFSICKHNNYTGLVKLPPTDKR